MQLGCSPGKEDLLKWLHRMQLEGDQRGGETDSQSCNENVNFFFRNCKLHSINITFIVY